jgi:hypothetical protein
MAGNAPLLTLAGFLSRTEGGRIDRRHLAQTSAPIAAILAEVVSPDDETYDKFGFHAAHGVHGVHGVHELIVSDLSPLAP